MANAQALAFSSPQHHLLNKLAQHHSQNMANARYQSHNNWENGRYQAALQAIPSAAQVAEICAETWPGQHNSDWSEQWAEYELVWRQSPGHWSVARRPHKFIGVGSAKGLNGIWYGCLIAVD
jgi:uncharacterized protein YkwD